MKKTAHSLIFAFAATIFLLLTIITNVHSQSKNVLKAAKARSSNLKPRIISADSINKRQAQNYFSEYARKVRSGKLPRHLCDTVRKKDTLRYLRLWKNTIKDHIEINEDELPKVNGSAIKYDGVRLYPYNYDTLKNTYHFILVYTKLNSTSKKHEDIDTTYFRVTIQGNFKWCELSKPHKKNLTPDEIFSSHHTCYPNCPDTKVLEF